MSNSEELHLVSLAAQGDERAFLALYDRFAARVYALTLRVLGDAMLAEEVTQDTFLKLWSRARQYNSTMGAFSTWLLTIAHRTALDRLRLEKRRLPASNEQDPDEVLPELPDHSTEDGESRWRSMYFAVQSLPAEQKLLIHLAFYKGLSQSEIAEVTKLPLGTVKTRLRAAMQTLRRLWLEEGG